jgi:predicted CXXCH cytochrome family protein
VSAADAVNKTPWGRSGGFLEDSRRNHPVGVRYPDRTPRNFSVPFRPVSSLPERIRLPEGKVGCVSCHDLYARDEHLLTVPIEGSELCLTCHDLR